MLPAVVLLRKICVAIHDPAEIVAHRLDLLGVEQEVVVAGEGLDRHLHNRGQRRSRTQSWLQFMDWSMPGTAVTASGH